MKPRTTLAETRLQDGTPLALQEHDGRLSLVIHGQQIAGPGTKHAGEELARLACAPFRPARQPKLLFAGLALGHTLSAATTELLQKRATLIVAEPLADIVQWHRDHIADSPILTDTRVSLADDCTPSDLARHQGTLHAIVCQVDSAPLGPNGRPWPEDPRWLAAAYDGLQTGGILALGATRRVPGLFRKLRQAGFDIAEYDVLSSPNAKKPRLLPIWLARKGARG